MDAAILAYLTAYTPSFSVLLLVLLVITVVLVKLDADRILALLDSRASLLLLATFLFSLVLVTHLFQKVDWTADLLKVLAGVLVGAASSAGKKEASPSGSGQSFTNVGDGNVQVGRDMIGEMRGDIQSLKDSIVHQSQTINQIAQIEGSTGALRVSRTFHERFETTDDRFISQLLDRRQQPDYDYWAHWVEQSLRHPEIGGAFRATLQAIQEGGWTIERLDFDNLSNGLHVNILASRALELS